MFSLLLGSESWLCLGAAGQEEHSVAVALVAGHMGAAPLEHLLCSSWWLVFPLRAGCQPRFWDVSPGFGMQLRSGQLHTAVSRRKSIAGNKLQYNATRTY